MKKTIFRKEAIIEMHFTWPGGGRYYSFTWGRPVLQLMSSPPIGINVLGGIYVRIMGVVNFLRSFFGEVWFILALKEEQHLSIQLFTRVKMSSYMSPHR